MTGLLHSSKVYVMACVGLAMLWWMSCSECMSLISMGRLERVSAIVQVWVWVGNAAPNATMAALYAAHASLYTVRSPTVLILDPSGL